MEDISAQICAAGELAVLEYGEVSGLRNEDQFPEVYMSCAMARHLHQSLGVNLKVERDYSLLAGEAALNLAPDRAKRLQALRADIVLYEGNRLTGIIEVKKFAEVHRASMIRDDLDKAGAELQAQVPVYVGVLVCETKQRAIDQRIAELERALAIPLKLSAPRLSSAGGWKWCFACGKSASGPDRAKT